MVDADPALCGTTLVNTATVTADQDPQGVSTTIDTPVECEADIEVMKTSMPVKVFAGEQKKYTVTVTNHGPSTAVDVVVVDTLPDGRRVRDRHARQRMRRTPTMCSTVTLATWRRAMSLRSTSTRSWIRPCRAARPSSTKHVRTPRTTRRRIRTRTTTATRPRTSCCTSTTCASRSTASPTDRWRPAVCSSTRSSSTTLVRATPRA